jgi:succinyl-diaminopimelate desuccinylase
MEPVQFLQDLLRIDSSNPPGNEHEVAKVIAARCERVGLKTKITEVETNRSNLEVRLTGNGTKRGTTHDSKKLLFCGHMDTVSPGETEWTYSPFSGELQGNKLYGRGASDMKSGLAGMFLAVESLYNEGVQLPGEIVFLATAGEEVDSCGARKYLESNHMKDFDAIVIGEPTNEKVVIGHKGALWLEIVIYGKTAHGSMPDQGVNAIKHTMEVISLIEQYDLEWKIQEETLGHSTMAVTRIGGGVQTNVIPDRCYVQVDIRTVPPQSHPQLIQELKDKLDYLSCKNSGMRAEIKPLLDRPALLTHPSSKIVQTALTIKGQDPASCYGVSYYTDGSVLNPHSEIQTLVYGPGDEKLAHQPNEWVDVDAYLRSITFYRELAIQYLNGD